MSFLNNGEFPRLARGRGKFQFCYLIVLVLHYDIKFSISVALAAVTDAQKLYTFQESAKIFKEAKV